MPESPNSAENDSVAPSQVDPGNDGQPPPDQPSLPKIVPFTDLARCGDEIWISHQGQLYRLQSTRAGKLILTK